MWLHRTRLRVLAVLGLPLAGAATAACQPLPGAVPDPVASDVTVVDIPASDNQVSFTAVDGDEDEPVIAEKGPLRRCGKDRYREWKCGRPRTGNRADKAKEPYGECTTSSDGLAVRAYYPINLTWNSSLPFDPHLTGHFRKKGVSYKRDPDSCCYSTCKPVVVKAKPDQLPSKWYTRTYCLPSFSRTSIPSTERADCPATIVYPGGPGGKFAAPFNASRTKSYSHQVRSYGGLEGVGVCCYEVPGYRYGAYPVKGGARALAAL